MIGLTTEYKLASVLQALANGEKDCEISRQVLSERAAFEPYTAFKRIARNSTVALSQYQVSKFMKENGMPCLDKDIQNVFNLYCTRADGKLAYTDFLELILPRNAPHLRQLATQRDSYHVASYEVLPYEVELGIAKCIDKEVCLSRKVELLKEDLVSRFDFSLRGAYDTIADLDYGRASFDALHKFFSKNAITALDKDVLSLFNRIDLDKDGSLSYGEFCEAVLPSDPYYRGIAEATKGVKPTLRTSTPLRHSTSRLSSSIYIPTSKRLDNSAYLDYLQESSAKELVKSSLLRRSLSPAKASILDESYNSYTKVTSPRALKSSYLTPTRGRSPARLEEISPMRGNEEDHLAQGLKEQMEHDRELEESKNKLALQDDLNLYDLFRYFDLTEKGWVTKLELREGFNDFDVFPSSNEMFLIMKKYNKDNDGLLKYSEFCEMMKPKEVGYCSLLTARKPTYCHRELLGDIFSDYTIELCRRALGKIVENEFHSEKIRQRLSRRPLFDSHDAFEALDMNKFGFFREGQIKELLSSHGFYATSKEIEGLMGRFDKNEDGKISYGEFINELTPQSPEKI